MAENIAFSITIGGVDREIKTMQDLKKAIKDANNELLQAGEVGTQSYAEAQKKVTDLKDKLGDLGDAAKVQGTAVEKLGASTGLLGEGFKNLDLDKIKIGFKGIGDAIKANPLMFLIGIIIPLLEKFKVFEILIGGVSKAFDLLTDAIGFTNHADEEATKKFLSNSQQRQKVVSAEYDARIKVAKAEGKNTYDLEQEKLRLIYNSTAQQYNSLLELAKKKKGLNDEEFKQYKDLQIQLKTAKGDLDASRAAEDKEAKDKEAARQKELTDKYKQAYQEQLQANQDLINKTKAIKDKVYLMSISDEKQLALETLRIQNEAQIEEINKSKANKKIKNDALKNLNESYLKEQQKINNDFVKKEIDNELKNLKESNNLKIAEAGTNYEKIRQLKISSLEAERNVSLSKGIDNELEYNAALLQINKEYEDAKLAQQIKANQDAYDEEERFNELRILQTKEGTKERLDAEIEAINTRAQHEINTGKKTAAEIALIKKKSGQQIAKLQEEFDDKEIKEEYKKAFKYISRTDQTFKTLGDLSTIFYNTKLNHAKKGSAEEEKILKQQFEVNKAFQIANAIINGATAVTGILASTSSKDPLGIIGVIRIAAAIATTAAQISTIERTRFESAAPQTPETPSMSAAAEQAPTGTPQMPQTRTEQGTFLNEQGQTTGRLDTRVYVLESDITSTQRDVNRVKTQSKV